MTYPNTFQRATELINTRPLPADIIEQLDALRAKTPREFRDRFDWFYEGAEAADEEGILARPVEGFALPDDPGGKA
jgi:hypothetical protein